MSESIAGERSSEFAERVRDTLATLPPAEQKMARFFVEQKRSAVLGSAAEMARMVGTSDATVVRTARSLGFRNLAALRQALLAEISGAISPVGRLQRTLDETGKSGGGALDHVIGVHEAILEVLKRGEIAEAFERARTLLAAAGCRHVFGIGPSGAVAEYAALQFNRIGLPTRALSASGVGLADGLLWMKPGDAVLMMAYAPLYREVTVVLDHARRLNVPVVLISDSLGAIVADQIATELSVPRGKAGHLAMHAGTMVLIEAMIIGLAGHSRRKAFSSLESLNHLRGSIDKSWSKRGLRRKARPRRTHSP